jgi:snurportin-1
MQQDSIDGQQFDDWLLIWCPPQCCRKRCLVVASNGNTVAYDRHGWRVDRFQSQLPGGSRGWLSGEYTILDCLRNEDGTGEEPGALIYRVVDIMCWRGHPVYDCDTEFRQYWLHTKLNELFDSPEQQRLIGGRHERLFFTLSAIKCSLQALDTLWEDARRHQQAMQQQNVEGVCLFYHRQAHYEFGHTPLALWLPASEIPLVRSHWLATT